MRTPITAIMAVYNEEETVQNACRQLHRCGVDSIVAIVNGCTDKSLENIEQLKGTLDCTVMVEQFEKPLGHDVSRAIGTYAALRRGYRSSVLLYVDADWAGSFGPSLEQFVQYGVENQAEVLSVTQSALSDDWRHDDTARLWRATLAMQSTIPHDAAPFLLPMLVQSSVFRKLSPIWLAHPGLWLASAVKAQLRWCTFRHWSMEMIGHKTRSANHRKAMEMQLQQDAQDAHRLLRGLYADTSFATILSSQNDIRHPTAMQLPNRDYSQLLQYASTLPFRC